MRWEEKLYPWFDPVKVDSSGRGIIIHHFSVLWGLNLDPLPFPCLSRISDVNLFFMLFGAAGSTFMS